MDSGERYLSAIKRYEAIASLMAGFFGMGYKSLAKDHFESALNVLLYEIPALQDPNRKST